MNLIKLTGARGVGKSTILSELRRDEKMLDKVEIIRSSSALSELSLKNYNKPLEFLNKVELFTVQESLIRIAKNMPQKVVIFDTHDIRIEPDGKITILTPAVHRKEFNCHIIIEAEPEIILRRRLNDKKNNRNLNLRSIFIEVEAERKLGMRMSSETHTNLYIVKNTKVIETAAKIKCILRKEFEILK